MGALTLIILVVNALVTYMGLKDRHFFDKYSFRVDRIMSAKDYKRLITSGFLHVSWIHFAFNMLTLYFFSRNLEAGVGIPLFALIYFGSLVGGNLFALYIHRNHPTYSAVGASGAVCGIIFASIALFPGIEIGIMFLPFRLPGWLYGIAFIAYSIYGIKSQRDNVGHEAHLGGGIIGLILSIIVFPAALRLNTLPIMLILIPSLVFLFIVIARPHLLITGINFGKSRGWESVDDRYNAKKVEEEHKLDRILDKINKKGIDSLSQKEREILEGFSGKRD